MRSWALAVLAGLLAAGCAIRPPHPEAFVFAVIGDTPYTATEEPLYQRMLDDLPSHGLAFLLHVGDFKGGGPCSDALYAKRLAQLDALPMPVIYTPGDNEWTECRDARMGGMDPLERLARLRALFFANAASRGAAPMQLETQAACLAPPVDGCGCGALPENRAWQRAGVRFATLHVVGADNNTGFDAANDAEARCRDAGNLRWLERWVADSEGPATRALVVAMQANPWFTRTRAFVPYIEALREASARLARPVLLVHGDTHIYRIDAPFRDAFGEPLPFLRRLETFGSPFVGWAKVTVDPAHPDVFVAEPRLFALSPENPWPLRLPWWP